MNKKRNLFLRFFAVLLAVLMLCMQLLPVGAAGEDEDRDAMISLYAALEVFYGVAGDILSSYGGPETYAFSGGVNEDNIDRIAGTALLLDISFYPDAYAGHLAAGALPGSLLESAIVTYFDVGDVDLSQSKNYDRKSDTYLVTDLVSETGDSYFPFCMLQNQFSFQYDISGSGTVTLDGVYMGINRFATGRLVFEIMMDVNGIKICSVDLTPTELLTLKGTSALEIENYTH